MEVALIIVFALLGTAIGSFLNVCIDRLPAGKSLLRPPSHCDTCQHRLSPKDLVPIFSYLWLRRRCRYCHAPITLRPFLVETGSGLLFAFLYWHYGPGIVLAVTAIYSSLFIVLAVIDLEHGLILNKIVYPAAAMALVIDVFLPQPGIISGAIGGTIGLVFLLLPALLYPSGMGWGDVKMAALIGLVTGFPLVLVALPLGAILGGVVAGGLLLLKVKKRKEAIPFGPFLSLATIVALLWGQQIVDWYVGLF
ncbi:MAG: prepilin peptidase [Chloroflexi bacterium]|nr:prepilin peptidase [Chloroflexota bacterium]